MVVNRFAPFLLVVGFLGLGTTAFAEEDAPQQKSLFERLDNFGKGIFGKIRPEDKSQKNYGKDAADTKETDRSSTRKAPSSDPMDAGAESPRAGSILSGNASPLRPAATEPSRPSSAEASRPATDVLGRPYNAYRPEDALLAAPRNDDKAAKPVRRLPIDSALVDDDDSAKPNAKATPMATSPAAVTAKSITQSSEVSAPSQEISESPTASGQPLHERLSNFRQSAFPSETQDGPAKQSTKPQPSAVASSTTASSKPVGAVPKLAVRPSIAERITPETRSETLIGPSLDASENKPTATEAKPNADDLVLFARKGPVLSVETLGPRKISVGKESVYEVCLVNAGEAAAEDLLVYVSLPEWAEVLATEPTVGQANAATNATGVVQWRIGHMNSKGQERLVLRIVPRQSKPFDLAVRWEYKPTASQAMIEVQEPKLVLQLEGPREVLYGKKASYRLKIVNSGTGAAESVTIMLMPLGTGENVAASHKLGTLGAGEEKTLDVELTARQAGNLTIQADARADGGSHAELAENVLVRRAALKADVEGPKMQFLGQQATYTIRLRNSGTAMANNIRLSVALPAGAKYQSGIDGAALDATGAQLEWRLEKLGPEADQSYVLHCNLGTAGTNRLEINAIADDDLNAVAVVNTRVESVANLVMDVSDPSGPVAVGEDAIYEVHVRNRGTKEAENVEIFAYFSRGLEPVAAEGSPNRIMPGQVVFLPIPTIVPGAEMVLKVRGRADAAGNHVFRAEAHCKPLGTRLIREATNLYYSDGPNAQQVAKETPADGSGVAPNAGSKGDVERSGQATERAADHPSQAEVTSAIPRK